MKPPTSYSGWVVCLARLARAEADEDTLQAMEQGTIVGADVTARVVARLASTLDERLRLTSKQFVRDIKAAQGQDALVVTALTDLRQRLRLLSRAAALPALPEEAREQLKRQLEQYAAGAQRSLEQTARADRSGWFYDLVRRSPL